MPATFIEQRDVPLSDLKPHPDNPNRGSVNDIAISLEENGQYRSVVALADGTILAGHHVVQAAKRLGRETIRVEFVDADDKTARKILLADNRLADLGLGANLDMLLDNLQQLGDDIEGTGFDLDYLRMLEEAVSGPPGVDDLLEEAEEDEEEPTRQDFFRTLSLKLDPKLITKWERVRKLFDNDSAAFASLLEEDSGDPAAS